MIYEYKNIYDLSYLLEKNNFEIINNKGKEYYNIPCVFNLLHSSFINEDKRIGVMFAMALTICEETYFIRSYDELKTMFILLKHYLGLGKKKKLIIYVHNLQKTFNFIKKRIAWDDVFCMSNSEVLYAKTTSGVEFRCSEKLSGLSQKELANENGNIYFDLSEISEQILTPNTVLKKDEIDKIVNNNMVVYKYIKDCIQSTKNKKISQIPYTLTGYTRNYVKEKTLCYGNSKYKSLLRSLTLNDEKEYNMLKNAFSGGYIYSNKNYKGIKLGNVHSYDFDSAYIYNLCTQKYPMGKGKTVYIKTKDEFLFYLRKYCCLFNVKFKGIEKKLNKVPYIQINNCLLKTDYTETDGRLLSADEIVTTVTDVDFRIIKNNYDFEKMYVTKMIIYKKDYLPKPLIDCIIKLYQNKTKLKNSKDKIAYIKAKRLLNSIYGMIVTDINKPLVNYDNSIGYTETKDNDFIRKYNKDPNRFIFYPWGVWCTAYNRLNLFTAINELGEDLIYSDTDSVKFINKENHNDYFDKYNKYVELQIKNVCNHFSIDFKTIINNEHTLGAWEYEGYYNEFKTLGNKKYAYVKKQEYNITVSGLPKEKAIKYLLNMGEENFIDNFNQNTNIPCECSDKIYNYNYETQIKGVVIDRDNIKRNYEELSYCYTEKVGYNFGMENIYINKILELGGY